MSVIEEAVVKIVRDDAGIGAIAGDRIYHSILKENVMLPAMTYTVTNDTERVASLSGPSLLVQPHFQINCWASNISDATGLETAVRQALDGVTTTVLGVAILGTTLTDHGDLFEPAVGKEVAQRRFGRRLEFDIWHREA